MKRFNTTVAMILAIGLSSTTADGQATRPASQPTGGAGSQQAEAVAATVNGHRILESDIETVFAAARIRAIALPINTRLSPREVCFLIDDSRPAALVSERHFRDLADAACQQARQAPGVRLEVGDGYEAALACTEPLDEIAAVDPDDPVLLMYTSGTTGDPKGVMLSHGNFTSNVVAALKVLAIGPDDTALSFLPLTTEASTL